MFFSGQLSRECVLKIFLSNQLTLLQVKHIFNKSKLTEIKKRSFLEKGDSMKVDRKELILEAAKTSFAMNGYKGTTMETVAKIAKVGKGTIYTFFTTKEELLVFILNKRILEMKSIADDAFASEGSFIEKTHKALYGVLDLRRWHKILATLISEARELRNPELVAILDRVDMVVVSYIKEKLDLMMKQGLIKACNTEFIAFMLYRLYTSILFEWEKNHPAFTEKEIANMVELMFKTGLST